MRKANPRNPKSKSTVATKVKNLNHFKPLKFRHYFTLAELCSWLEGHGEGRHKTSIIKLERDGKIPQASRAQCGQIDIRLWSPKQAQEILRLLKDEIRPGRPPNA